MSPLTNHIKISANLLLLQMCPFFLLIKSWILSFLLLLHYSKMCICLLIYLMFSFNTRVLATAEENIQMIVASEKPTF